MTSQSTPSVGLQDLLARLTPPVAEALAEVEDRLAAVVPLSGGGVVSEIYHSLLASGGKRLRPLLTLLSCAASGGEPRQAVLLAVGIEVLHLASLIHDDVIDESDERRGRPSARRRWGNRAAILAGDFLVAEVFRHTASDLGREALTALASAVAEMCRAELLERESGREITLSEYADLIGGKTGVLMAAACEVGAIAAHNDQTAPDLHRFGRHLGEAFQITDDLLDLYGDPEVMGKPVWQDLQRGDWTLPVLQALEVASEVEAAALRETLQAARTAETAAAEAARLVEALGGRAYAVAAAAEHLAQGLEHLQAVPPGPERELLADLAACLLSREK